MRLIDADKLKQMRFSCGYNNDDELLVPFRDVVRAIDQAPTVDAVEVVRCGDCAFYSRYCAFDDCVKPQDHYCAYGERKDDNNG